jgi:hypothetical protein
MTSRISVSDRPSDSAPASVSLRVWIIWDIDFLQYVYSRYWRE